jgi:CubicO group peptidase (beta-lactamase class C family)
MRKTAAAWLLLLCLLAGCASVTAWQEAPQAAKPPAAAYPAYAPPLMSQFPETSDVQPSPGASVLPSEPVPSAEAAAASPSADPAALAALSEQLDQLFAGCPEFSGSVLIEKGGQILLSKGYGMADAAGGAENTPDTKFLTASVTKQFTAMAVMQLYEKGRLDLTDRLSEYIPDFPRGGDITLWNLLTQTSGIPDFLNDDPKLLASVQYKELSEDMIIGLIEKKPLKFEPGTKYAYSNTNYVILGTIVEKVSGMGYGDYLFENIFKPLGMEDTGVFDIDAPPEGMAAGHIKADTPVDYDDPDPEKNYDVSTMGIYGAGCLYSTVGDLYLWDQALRSGTLLPKSYMNMIFAPSVYIPGALVQSYYGYGWVIENDPDVGRVIRHTGALSGFRAYNGLFPDIDATVVILYNNMTFTGRDGLIPAIKGALAASSRRG